MFTFTEFDQKVFAKKQDCLGLQILKLIHKAKRLRANENGHIEIYNVETQTWDEKLPKSLESGYMRVSLFDGISVYEHDAVFVAAYGYIPGEIDHIDTHKDNNKVENLRETSHTDNIRRRGALKRLKLTVEDFAELLEAIEAGVNKKIAVPAMAAKYGCCAQTIRNWARKLGIYWVTPAAA